MSKQLLIILQKWLYLSIVIYVYRERNNINQEAIFSKIINCWRNVCTNLWFCICVILQVNCQFTHHAKLTINFIQYYNPNEKLYNGKKCDIFTKCDYVFDITVGTSRKNNSYYSVVSNTFEYGETVYFSSGTKLAPNVKNPIVVFIPTPLPVSYYD